MFIDASRYGYLGALKANVPLIRREFDGALRTCRSFADTFLRADISIDHYSDFWVRDNGFHPEQIGNDIRAGQYSALAIYKAGFPIRTFDASVLFGNTLALLSEVPNLHFAAFFVMHPVTHLQRHQHTRSHLIYHLLLNDLLDGACEMKCGHDTIMLSRAGDEALFDYSLPHETYNHAANARVHLVVDFLP